jgi:hypothetical protein
MLTNGNWPQGLFSPPPPKLRPGFSKRRSAHAQLSATVRNCAVRAVCACKSGTNTAARNALLICEYKFSRQSTRGLYTGTHSVGTHFAINFRLSFVHVYKDSAVRCMLFPVGNGRHDMMITTADVFLNTLSRATSKAKSLDVVKLKYAETCCNCFLILTLQNRSVPFWQIFWNFKFSRRRVWCS